ncbi:MAG: phosphoribosylglycinamide formyltransferase [Chlorobi bacterium]|nr:phosphoribosylglycinamide formyltransferase [Chlorobiota bacterium]
MNIAVFVSGRGSNLRSIQNSIKNGEMKVKIVAVVSDKTDCAAFDFAHSENIQTYSVFDAKRDGFSDYFSLTGSLLSSGVELIVLAGFLKKIPVHFLESFRDKIINIHPALLPAFGGKGMYGMNVHKAVFNSSAKVSGATVHFVNANYDEGKIIAQRCVEIEGVKSPEEIAEKVLKIEHELLPFVVKKISEKKVFPNGNRIEILN